jgi:hypothetical protein
LHTNAKIRATGIIGYIVETLLASELRVSLPSHHLKITSIPTSIVKRISDIIEGLKYVILVLVIQE